MIGLVRGLIGAALFVLYMLLLVRTYSPKHRAAFDRMAALALDETDSDSHHEQ